MTTKEAAKELFFIDWSQKKIAETLKKSEQTISNWAEEENWDIERASQRQNKKSIQKRLENIINDELQLVEEESKKGRESGKPVHVNPAVVDVLSKLLAGTKAKELTFALKIKVLSGFIDWIGEQNSTLAKQLTVYSDNYIYKMSKENQ